MNIYIDSFLTFAKIGAFTLGGGYAMLPLIEAEVVEKKKWIDSKEFLDLVAVAQSAPGVFAVNISIFIGYKLRKIPGAIVLTLGTILPSFLIILLIAMFFQQFKDNRIVESIFKGIRPAVVALIAAPTFKLAKDAKISRYTIWIPVVSALLIWLLGFSPVSVIILAGIGGYLYGRFYTEDKKAEQEDLSVLADEAARKAKEKEKEVKKIQAEIEEAQRQKEKAIKKEAEAQKRIEEAKVKAAKAQEEAEMRKQEERRQKGEEPSLFDMFDPRRARDDND
ncbi:MAG: chromate transporter [Bacteroidaceae bacterium]|nr:chromate transporter [Bacteroidaceae bacterium]